MHIYIYLHVNVYVKNLCMCVCIYIYVHHKRASEEFLLEIRLSAASAAAAVDPGAQGSVLLWARPLPPGSALAGAQKPGMAASIHVSTNLGSFKKPEKCSYRYRCGYGFRSRYGCFYKFGGPLEGV